MSGGALQALALRTHLIPPDLLDRLPPGPGRFLLESPGGPPDIARYSFFGVAPFLRMVSRGRRIGLAGPEGKRTLEGDPLAVLDSLLDAHRTDPVPGLPPFQGGAVGYLAYDLGRLLEPVPATARDDLQVPDLYLGFYRTVAALDHRDGTLWILGPDAPRWAEALTWDGAAAPAPGAGAPASAPAEGAAPAAPAAGAVPMVPVPGAPGLWSNFSPEGYRAAVRRAIDYIYAGDVFQVNLAQRFVAWVPCSPWDLYRRLRAVNPAPFAAYLDCGDFVVVPASPERFLYVEGGRVETRPIKGTRPRGATPEDDAARAAELLASEKDRAELNMIVDLERNDLGRVCRTGTVRVPDRRRLEAYPTVFHTVATVTGELKPGTTAGQLLRATFPGGSITGAPKVRAMAIIEELEGVRRGVYCGAIGYLAFSGTLDLNIAIRTLVVRGGWAYFHAGGGIVAGSDPEAEYAETLAKARGLVRALGLGVGL